MTTQSSQSGATTEHVMQCMEVWGGNRASDNGVVMPGLNLWVYSRPYEDASGGGDVHYVSSCMTGRIARILLADVAGHGAKVDTVADDLRTLMRKYVNFVDQTALVRQLNRDFSVLADAGTFATAVVATYWAMTDYLILSNAGHPRPLLFRAKKSEWNALDRDNIEDADGAAHNLPLGIDAPTEYDSFAVRLRRDDLILVYTDAVVEARLPDGSLLGQSGLLDIVRALDATRPDTLISSLMRALADRRCELTGDDLTILLLHHNGLRPARLTIREWFTRARLFASMTGERLSTGSRSAPIPWPEARISTLLGPFIPKLNNLWGGAAPEGSASDAPTHGADPPEIPRQNR